MEQLQHYGIYCWRKNFTGEIVYIGRTHTSFGQRKKEHELKSHNAELKKMIDNQEVFFDILLSFDKRTREYISKDHVEQIEAAYIYNLKPQCNRMYKNHTYKETQKWGKKNGMIKKYTMSEKIGLIYEILRG